MVHVSDSLVRMITNQLLRPTNAMQAYYENDGETRNVFLALPVVDVSNSLVTNGD